MKAIDNSKLILSLLAPPLLVWLGFQISHSSNLYDLNVFNSYAILFIALILGIYALATSVHYKKYIWLSIYTPVMFVILFYVGLATACYNGNCL